MPEMEELYFRYVFYRKASDKYEFVKFKLSTLEKLNWAEFLKDWQLKSYSLLGRDLYSGRRDHKEFKLFQNDIVKHENSNKLCRVMLDFKRVNFILSNGSSHFNFDKEKIEKIGNAYQDLKLIQNQ